MELPRFRAIQPSALRESSRCLPDTCRQATTRSHSALRPICTALSWERSKMRVSFSCRFSMVIASRASRSTSKISPGAKVPSVVLPFGAGNGLVDFQFHFCPSWVKVNWRLLIWHSVKNVVFFAAAHSKGGLFAHILLCQGCVVVNSKNSAQFVPSPFVCPLGPFNWPISVTRNMADSSGV